MHAQSKSTPNTDRQRQAPAVPSSGAVAEAKSTPPGPPTLSKTPLPFDEEVPPTGADNLMFSDAEIRYCLAQIIRIEVVRPLVNRYERAQVGYFNELVADYNSRCGHYRYMEGARDSAQAQVEISRSTIESDARQGYLWRFVESEKSTAPPRSTAQTPAQEAKKPPKSAAAPQADSTTSQPTRSAPPKQQPATPTRTEPAQSAAAQAQAKQQASESPPAAPTTTTQPVPSLAPPSQPAASQQAPAAAAEAAAQPTAPQSQSKPQPSEASPSSPLVGAQPEHSAALAPQTATQQIPPIASAQDTRAAESSASARAIDQAPPASGPDASSQPNRPSTPAAQVQGKQQAKTEAATAATPAPPQDDHSREAAPAQEAKPTSVAKARTDGAPAGAIERFTREVERTGAQTLDQRDYPSEARDKNWEGTTLIEVRYAEGGYIRSIVVGQSSGHPALDETAVQVARNLRLPNAPEELRSREFAVRFPIVFKLSKP